MAFRPALWMTVFSVAALAVLLALGSWQLVRMQWKEALIAEFSSRAQSAPVDVLAIDPSAPPRYRRIVLEGVWLNEREVQLTGKPFEGTAGYHVVTPFRLDDGRVVLVNRGWVPQKYRAPESRPSTWIEGQTSVEAIIRLPREKGYFVPENDPGRGDWFTLDIDEIAHHVGIPDVVVKSFSVDAVRKTGARTLPIGSAVDINIPNNHWNYALTWYGLAIALVCVYIAWHRQAGRLTFRGDKDGGRRKNRHKGRARKKR